MQTFNSFGIQIVCLPSPFFVLCHFGNLVCREPCFFDPSTHFKSFLIGFHCLLSLTGISIRLSKIEDVTFIIRFFLQCLFKNFCISFLFVVYLGTASKPARNHKEFTRKHHNTIVFFLIGWLFMKNTLLHPIIMILKELGSCIDKFALTNNK